MACRKAGAERDRTGRRQLSVKGAGHDFRPNARSVALIAAVTEQERNESVPVVSSLIAVANNHSALRIDASVGFYHRYHGIKRAVTRPASSPLP